MHQIGALVVKQHAGLHQPQLHGRHLDALLEIDAIEPVAEAAELQDIVLTGEVVRMSVTVFGRHVLPLGLELTGHDHCTKE